MQTELEAKFPDIDVAALRQALAAAGAHLEHAERQMRRRNFDYPDDRLEEVAGWIRVRDEGDKTTLAYKQLNDRSLHGTQEVALDVESFEKMEAFFKAIGMKAKAYQETKRERWLLEEVEVTIDTWPWIPSFVELEGPSEAALQAVAATLGLDWSEAMHGSVENVYMRHYDVTEYEVDNWMEIRFGPVPADLEAKRRQT